MSYYFLIILLTVCTNWVQAADTKLKIVVRGNYEFTPTVDYGFGKQTIKYDSSTGVGEFVIDLQAPMNMVLESSKYIFQTIYLSPGADMTVNIDNRQKPAIVTFSGENSRENEFLNASKFYSIKLFDTKKKSDILEISRLTDSMLNVHLLELKQVDDLSEEFCSFEALRLKANAAKRFLRECSVQENNQTLFKQQLGKRIYNDSQLVNIHEYRSFLKDAVKRFATMETSRMRDDERTGKMIEATLQRVENRDMRAYLIDAYVTPHIAFAGTSGADYYIDLFNQYVTNPVRIKNFKTIRALSEVADKGKHCPNFTFNDVHDNAVSLNSLSGKYVFIDLWATWCGPCKAEIPFVQQLEEQFHGKEITFVSISVDKNKDKQMWKEMVEQKKMGGIQLILGENWNWIKNFMPTSLVVPRFILLDKKGVIIDPNMSRPSDPKTAKFLENLLTK